MKYWITNASTSWNITAYGQSLSEKKLVNYRQSHVSLKEDLSLISQTFIHHPAIVNIIKQLSAELKNIKKDRSNTYFWSTISPTIQLSHMDRSKSEFQKESAYLGIDSSLLKKHARQLEEKNNDADDTLPSAAKKHQSSLLSESTTSVSSNSIISTSPELASQPQSESTTPTPTPTSSPLQNQLDLVEIDTIISDSSRLTIGTIIKRKALLLHDQYKNDKPLSPRQRKIMSNGLSSILDLVDQSYPSQRSLFTSLEWQQMNQLFTHKYGISVVDLDPVLNSTWKIVCGSVNELRNVKIGLLYLYRIYPNYHFSNTMPSLKVFEHILDLVHQEEHLLQKKWTTSVSESDYLSYIWIPLFRRLFPTECTIRIKTGETCYPYSSKCKQDLYSISSNVCGFKVDLRFVVEKDGLEYDVCSVEAATDPQVDVKVVSDEGKLNREVKDDLDAMIEMTGDSTTTTPACCGWGIQITGASCVVLSLHLSDNGLYVALPQFDINLPRSIAGLKGFSETMSYLLTFRQQLFKSADYIHMHTKFNSKQLDPLNRCDTARLVDDRQRDTWYTPPENTQSRKPVNFTGLSSLPPLKANLLSVACRNSLDTLNDKNDSNGGTDEFGWKRDGKMWRNVFTGESLEHSPYEDTNT